MLQMGEQLIYLIPELCHLTGMSEDIRKNFQITKDISEHTKPNPANRVQALRKFVDSIRNCPEASAELNNWGVSLRDVLIDNIINLPNLYEVLKISTNLLKLCAFEQLDIFC